MKIVLDQPNRPTTCKRYWAVQVQVTSEYSRCFDLPLKTGTSNGREKGLLVRFRAHYNSITSTRRFPYYIHISESRVLSMGRALGPVILPVCTGRFEDHSSSTTIVNMC